MSQERERGSDTADGRLSDDYRAAVGAVVAARASYEEACAADGPNSIPARQANDALTHAVDHRDEMREQYDRVIYRRPTR